MNAVEVLNVSKKYRDFAVENISFSLPGGTILGLVGENGAGKSTTIGLIMNAVKKDSGSIRVLGEDNTSAHFFSTKDDIGVVLDEACFADNLTAVQINKIMKNTYKNWNEYKFTDYLKRFELPEKKEFKDFSRGMQMKLSIATALSHGAKLLILDEATSGLDPIVRDEILDIFNEFASDENHSVILSSHIVSDLEKICDYIAFIHKGRLMMFDEKDALLEKYVVVKMTKEQYAELPQGRAHSVRNGNFGIEALFDRRDVPVGFTPEHTTLEEIIVFLAKGEKR